MIKIKSNKGITLTTLVISVIVLIILSGTIIYSINSHKGASKYKSMVADINLLNDKLLIYFNKYGELPKTSRLMKIKVDGEEEIKYYEIDLSKLGGVTLNYGKDYGQTEELTKDSDVYLVNSSLQVYYLKGLEKNEEIYHSEKDIGQPEMEADIEV